MEYLILWFDHFSDSRAEIFKFFRWYFGPNNDTKRTFWNKLTWNKLLFSLENSGFHKIVLIFFIILFVSDICNQHDPGLFPQSKINTESESCVLLNKNGWHECAPRSKALLCEPSYWTCKMVINLAALVNYFDKYYSYLTI